MKNLIKKLSDLGLIQNNSSLANGVDIKIINNIAGLYNLKFFINLKT